MGRFFEEYMPHGYCYLWMPEVLWLNVLSDAAIFLAYFSIPISLMIFISRSANFPFGRITILFSLFILTCGLTHAMSIWTVWNGDYGIHGLFKLVTAIVSVITAIALVPVIPRALAFRSPAEYEATLAELRAEIAERKRAEAVSGRLQRDLAHVTRLSTVSEMTASLAHELNQPLAAITLYCQAAMSTAKADDKTSPEIIGFMQEVRDQAKRAGDVIHQLRQFVGKGEPEKVDTEVNALVRETVHLIEPVAREVDVKINLSLEPNDIDVSLSPVQIAQVIVNLLRNSVEAISEADSPERQIWVDTKLQGNEVAVSIEDSGPGISPGKDVFKSFESTKEDGMGMGLSISRTIIEAHGGQLIVDSGGERGARFTFTLPVSSKGISQ